MQSYLNFLQENMPTRSAQSAYVDTVMQNEPFFEGQSKEQVAKTLANLTGFEPLRRFSEPSSLTRLVDAFGTGVQEGFTNLALADYIPGRQESEFLNAPVSQHTGAAFENTAKYFGAEDDTAQAFGTAGEAVPNILGQMGMAGIGALAAPFTGGASLTLTGLGLAGTYTSMYGQGLDSAYQQGEFGWKSHAVGAVGPAMTALTFGLARPLTNKAGSLMMAGMQRFSSPAAGKVLAQGLATGGSAGLAQTLASGTLSVGTKAALSLGTEAMVNTVQAGIGIAGEVAQAAILDPKEFVTKTMWDKQFWIPTLTSELIEGFLGTVIGRARNPITANTAEQVVDPTTGETMQGEVDDSALFDTGEKTERGIDPADPTSDQQVLEAAAIESTLASSEVVAQQGVGKTAKVDIETGETTEADLPNTLFGKQEVISATASAVNATTDLGLHADPVKAAVELLEDAATTAPANVDPGHAMANTLEILTGNAERGHRDHRLVTGENDSFIAFRNPDTKQAGVYTEVFRGGTKAHATRVALNVNDFLSFADPAVDTNAYLAQKLQLDDGLAPAEVQALDTMGQNVRAQYDKIPAGLSFAPDPSYTQPYMTGMLNFFESSGLQEALVNSGIKLRFGYNSSKMSDVHLKETPLDYFSSMDRAQNTQYAGGSLHYISRYKKNFTGATDFHEIGHTVGHLLRNGGFGDSAKTEWVNLLEQATKGLIAAPRTAGMEGIRLKGEQLKLEGETSDTTLEQEQIYYARMEEIEAQLFQGYMFNEKNTWSNFVKKNYPSVHALFSKMFESIRALVTTKSPYSRKVGVYMPGQEDANVFFKRLLEDPARKLDSTKRNLRRLIQTNKLDGAAKDAVAEVYLSAKDDVARRNVTDVLSTWRKSLTEPEATPSDISNLIDDLSLVKQLNELNIQGFSDVGKVVTSMPWASKLRSNKQNLDELRLKIERATPRSEKLDRQLNNLFLTDEQLDQLENMRDVKVGSAEFRKIANTMSRRSELALKLDQVGWAVDEMLTRTAGEQVSPGKIVKQLFQIDMVVRDWMLGKLPGQNGQPMYDKDSGTRSKSLPALQALTGERSKASRPEYLRNFNQWFPILSKEIEKRVTVVKSRKSGFMKVDGSVSIGGEKTTTRNRISFASIEEVNAAMEVYRQNPELKGYNMSPVKEKSGKWFVKVEEVNSRDARTTFVDAYDVEAVQADQRELANQNQLLVAQQLADKDSFVNDPYEKLGRLRREAVLQKQGGKLMNKAFEVIPEVLRKDASLGHVPRKLKLQGEAVMQWGKAKAENAAKLAQYADVVGLKGTVMPDAIALRWVELKLQNKNPTLIRQAERDFENLGVEDMVSYIKSYEAHAKNVTRDFLAGEFNRAVGDPVVNGFEPPVVDPSERGVEANLANTNIMLDKNIASGVQAALSTLPGPRNPGKIQASKDLVKSIFGKPLKWADKLHAWYGQGAIHRAMSDQDFAWVGPTLHRERLDSAMGAHMAKMPLFGEGTFDPTSTANTKFRLSRDAKIDKNSPMFVIKNDAKLTETFQEILLFQNYSGKAFELALKDTDETVRKEAQRLLELIPQDKRGTFDEALHRLYAGQLEIVHHRARENRKNHIMSFASMLNLDSVFKGDASSAIKFAFQFAEVPNQTRLDMLIGIGRNPIDAQLTVQSYAETERTMTEMNAFMLKHPEYITEKRLKDYHVGVVFKKGTKSKSGLAVPDDKPMTGYYDFDSPEEAYAFIAEMKAQGHKVPDSPKDYKQQRYTYKPVTGSMEEIMTRVHQSRQALVETMIHGELDNELATQVISVLDNMTSEIVAENDAVKLTGSDKLARQFTEGRENLDMVDQYVMHAERLTSALARRSTDITFRLYKRDRKMIEKSADFDVMDSFREGVRRNDSEAQKAINKIGFTMFIGGNLSTALMELSQFSITLSPILMEHGASVRDAYVMPAKLFKKASQAAMRRLQDKSDKDIWDNPEHSSLLRFAENAGALNQMKHHDISDNNINSMTDMYQAEARELGAKGLASNVMNRTYSFMNKTYGFFNRINAELSIISVYEVLRKNQYKGKKDLLPSQKDALFREAIRINDIANGSLQRLGRPAVFNTRNEGVRTAASAFWSLQSFVNAQVANQIRLMRKSINDEGKWSQAEKTQARKAVAGLFGVQFAVMGTMGFTLVPGIAKLVQSAFGFDAEDELREWLHDDTGKTVAEQNFLGELATNGIPAALGFPVDFQSRMSISGIGPISAYSGIEANQLGGPVVGLATQLFRDIPKVRAGDMDLTQMSQNLLPMGIRRAAKLAFFDDGKIVDANKRVMFEPTLAETIGTVLGFNTLRAKQEMRRRMEQDEAEKADSVAKAAAYNAINREAMEGSPMLAQRMLLETAQKFNMDPRLVASNAARKFVDKTEGPTPREGTGPAALQAKSLYASPLGNVSHLNRLNQTEAHMQRLGIAPTTRPQTRARAAAMDALQSVRPELTNSMASKLLTQNPLAVRQYNTTRQVTSLQELLPLNPRLDF